MDRCEGCGGVWFEFMEFERLQEHEGAKALDRSWERQERSGARKGAKPKADAMLWPRCDGRTLVRMAVHGQPHVQYERCKVCHGGFPDGGEFRDAKDSILADRIKATLRA